MPGDVTDLRGTARVVVATAAGGGEQHHAKKGRKSPANSKAALNPPHFPRLPELAKSVILRGEDGEGVRKWEVPEESKESEEKGSSFPIMNADLVSHRVNPLLGLGGRGRAARSAAHSQQEPIPSPLHSGREGRP